MKKKSFDMDRQKKKLSAEIEEKAILSLEATKTVKAETGQCLSELQNDPELLQLWNYYIDCVNFNITCDANHPYRSIDGSCNNLDFPEFGMAFTPQARFTDAHYEDGVDTPREYDMPSPRLISNKLFNGTDGQTFDRKITAELMAWGQLLAHDFVLTPTIDGSIDCCDDSNQDNPACYTIEIPNDDEHFTSDCMNFVRSSPATTGCLPGHREQLNEITSFIDGSMLYGSTEDQMKELREFTGGRMKCTDTQLLPENPDGSCIKDTNDDFCQAAGDNRVDESPNLGGNHILLMREHNRIADKLAQINPHWDDERIFQETRKIVAAEIQHITYAEYLPLVIGPEAMIHFGLQVSNRGHVDPYDPTVDPSVRNAFAAAAFRFGHSQIMPFEAYLSQNFQAFESFPLENLLMCPHIVQQQQGTRLPDLMRWLSYDKSMRSDRFFEKEVRDLLFLKDGKSSDLPARNVQRGRDHGLPSYNEFRMYCGLPTATRWNPNTEEGLVDHRWRDTRILKDLYKNVADIDLFVGGITEKKLPGALVGPTFACLIGEQFSYFKEGDRFWYERPDPITRFKTGQLNSIKRMRLAKMFCENFDLDQIQQTIFLAVTDRNQLVNCSDLPDIDFSLWTETS